MYPHGLKRSGVFQKNLREAVPNHYNQTEINRWDEMVSWKDRMEQNREYVALPGIDRRTAARAYGREI